MVALHLQSWPSVLMISIGLCIVLSLAAAHLDDLDAVSSEPHMKPELFSTHNTSAQTNNAMQAHDHSQLNNDVETGLN